ncbi:MAG TPA: hypothetical protein ACFYD6_05945 [Candidatus Brocadiia bacterium]|nr:hypothetical protein [Planctomycetota bacterium]MDO8093849.1 hypothetical protein [Candidatus Brocadiales bacterium]
MKGLIKKILKNTLGVMLIILGLVILFTPFTPGSWIALIGLSLLDFPGKRRLVAKLKATGFYMRRIAPVEERIRKKLKKRNII